MVDLTSLLKRVRAASGPDRELDEDIATGLHLVSGDHPAEQYTASLHTVAYLIEHLFPGWCYSLTGTALLWDDENLIEERLATPPLSAIAALLTAMQANGSRAGKD